MSEGITLLLWAGGAGVITVAVMVYVETHPLEIFDRWERIKALGRRARQWEEGLWRPRP